MWIRDVFETMGAAEMSIETVGRLYHAYNKIKLRLERLDRLTFVLQFMEQSKKSGEKKKIS